MRIWPLHASKILFSKYDLWPKHINKDLVKHNSKLWNNLGQITAQNMKPCCDYTKKCQITVTWKAQPKTELTYMQLVEPNTSKFWSHKPVKRLALIHRESVSTPHPYSSQSKGKQETVSIRARKVLFLAGLILSILESFINKESTVHTLRDGISSEFSL